MNSTMARWSSITRALFLVLFASIEATARTEAVTSSRNIMWLDRPSTLNLLRGSRMLGDRTITTPNCDVVRTAPYPAELQLFYTYSVEINDDILLSDMERAMENAVAIELDMCDVEGRPVYKVKTGVRHSFSTSGKCDPIVDGNTCIVVNGETAVFLDTSSDANFVRNRAHIGILHGLGDSSFLDGFSNSVVSAALISEGHASLVETSDSHYESFDRRTGSYSSITTTVAVAAASVTIVVASIFFYGFLRRGASDNPSVRHRKNRSLRKSSPRTIVSGSHLSVPIRRHFVRLEDMTASPTSFITNTNASPQSSPNKCVPEYIEEEYDHHDDCDSEDYPNVNWSVSDITCDSVSLRSSVSRTPSTLERIEEEIEDDEKTLVDSDRDDNSCNFSYSEDSTMITNSSSKAGEMDPKNRSGDGNMSHNNTNVAEFDCASERRDRLLDLSDLDACFTILPGSNEDVFCDLDDLSSEGSDESMLESSLLDMEMSLEESDECSLQASVSDTSVVSMVPLSDLIQRDLVEDSVDDLSMEHANSQDIMYKYSYNNPKHSVCRNLTPLSSISVDDSLVSTILEMQVFSEQEVYESSSPVKCVNGNLAVSDSKVKGNTEVDAMSVTSRSKSMNAEDDFPTVVNDDSSESVCDVHLNLENKSRSLEDASFAFSSGDTPQDILSSLQRHEWFESDMKVTDTPAQNENTDLSLHYCIGEEQIQSIDSSCEGISNEQTSDFHPVDNINEVVQEQA